MWPVTPRLPARAIVFLSRSEEHTSELQSLRHLVCRLLLEKKNECFSSHGVREDRSPAAVSRHAALWTDGVRPVDWSGPRHYLRAMRSPMTVPVVFLLGAAL